MSKGQRIIIWIMCGLSLVLSVAAVCMAYYRTPDLGFDYQGVIVGVLSLLVTVLIGWNIYTTIGIESRIGKFKYAVPVSLCTSLAQLGRALYNNDDYANALMSLLNALAVYEKGSEDEMMEAAFSYSVTTIKAIRQKGITIECNKDDYIAFLNAALKTKDKEIISYVKDFLVI